MQYNFTWHEYFCHTFIYSLYCNIRMWYVVYKCQSDLKELSICLPWTHPWMGFMHRGPYNILCHCSMRILMIILGAMIALMISLRLSTTKIKQLWSKLSNSPLLLSFDFYRCLWYHLKIGKLCFESIFAYDLLNPMSIVILITVVTQISVLPKLWSLTESTSWIDKKPALKEPVA